MPAMQKSADTGGDLYRLSFDFYCQPDQAEAVVEALFDACVEAGAALGVKVEGASGGIVASDLVDDAIGDLVRERDMTWGGAFDPRPSSESSTLVDMGELRGRIADKLARVQTGSDHAE